MQAVAVATAVTRPRRADRLYALFVVGVALGLRLGELLGLRWVDVDLDQKMLRVRQSIERVHGVGLIIGPPKSRRSLRDIPLPVYAVRGLVSTEIDRRPSVSASSPTGKTPGWCSPRRSALQSSRATSYGCSTS